MKKHTFFFLACLILTPLLTTLEGEVLALNPSPSIYEGFLFLTGDNVTTIEGRFDINGSIIVEENATLIFRDAVVNFVQIDSYQFFMTFRNSRDDGPRLILENTTISTNGFYMNIHLFENSSAAITGLRMDSAAIWANDQASINVSNSHLSMGIGGQDSSVIDVSNCTFTWVHALSDSRINVTDSTISNYTLIGLYSINYTIAELKPGIVNNWNGKLNSSFTVALGGAVPDLTLNNTYVGGWSLRLYERSNVTLCSSIMNGIWSYDSSSISICNSSITASLYCHGSSRSYLYGTMVHEVFSYGISRLQFVNSTSDYFGMQDNSSVSFWWYLDIHVMDSIGQNVPAANVTANYHNSTVAVSASTDLEGWTRLTLSGKALNATGDYPVGNYTIMAMYLSYFNVTTANMTENQVVSLMLGGFVIPEFASLLILPVVVAVLLAVLMYRKRKRILVH